MFTGPVGPVEVFFYWPEAVIVGNFYWPGAIGSPLASSPVYTEIGKQSNAKTSNIPSPVVI